jgi:hypothetical protein
MRIWAHVAQSVERFLGKEEVHRFNSGRGLHLLNGGRREILAAVRKKIEMPVLLSIQLFLWEELKWRRKNLSGRSRM